MLIDFSRCKRLVEVAHGVGIRKVLHVGAHLGEEAKAYYTAGVSHATWFEADSDLIPTLQSELSKVKLQSVIVPLALFEFNGKMQFHVANNRQSSSLYEFGTHAESYPSIKVIDVREFSVFRLDTIASLEPPLLPWMDFDFINIDTQGSELSILKGAGDLLSHSHLKGIYLEVNRTQVYAGNPLVGEIDRYLFERNFHRIVTSWTPEGWGDAFYLKSASADGH